MITKAAPYNCTGVIWYQGENDDVDGLQELDGDMIESLINDWRDAWQDQEFPFFQVQLSVWGSQMMRSNHDYASNRHEQENVTK